MLVLTRKRGESVMIGEDITVTVVSIDSRGTVRLGFDSPRTLPVFRTEIVEEIRAEGRPIRAEGEVVDLGSTPSGWPINNEVLVDIGREFDREGALSEDQTRWLVNAAAALSNALDEAR